MGQVLHKWKRQVSSREALEFLGNVGIFLLRVGPSAIYVLALEQELDKLRKKQKVIRQWKKNAISLLLILFLLTYPLLIGGSIVCYIWFPGLLSVGAVVGYLFMLVILPVLFYAMYKGIVMYFEHRKSQYDLAMDTVTGERRKVLDEVMEKEPYNVARELLEKYDPQHPSLVQATPKPIEQPPSQRAVRRRRATPAPPTIHPAYHFTRNAGFSPVPEASRTPSLHPSTTPRPQVPIAAAMGSSQPSEQFIPPGHCLGAAPGPPVPVPILPRERTNFDKVVEYLVGDGPGNRYALICAECHSHNGMALKDQFPYLTFRCAYCYHLNPAKEKLPVATSKPETMPAPQQPLPVPQQPLPEHTSKPATIDESEETPDAQ